MAWLRRRRQANKERMKRREFYTRELQRFWRGYCGRRDIWNAKEYQRLLKLHTNQVIGFQACYRGYKIRLVDPAGCLPASGGCGRNSRVSERCAPTIQAAGRGWSGRKPYASNQAEE